MFLVIDYGFIPQARGIRLFLDWFYLFKFFSSVCEDRRVLKKHFLYSLYIDEFKWLFFYNDYFDFIINPSSVRIGGFLEEPFI